MRNHEPLVRALRDANPVPDARRRYSDSDESGALALLIEERRNPVPAASRRETLPPEQRTRAGLRWKPVLAFALGLLLIMGVIVPLVLVRGTKGGDLAGAPGFPIGAYGAGWSDMGAGIGYLEFSGDGTGRVLTLTEDVAGLVEVSFGYRLDGHRLIVTDDATPWPGCRSGEPGTFAWSISETALVLDPVEEPCPARQDALTLAGWGWSWYPLGTAPIVDGLPGDTPISVDTPLGTIEWTSVAGGPLLSQVGSVPGGFVAIARYGTEAGIVTSPDGRVWTAIPPPPEPPHALAIRENVLYVLSGLGEPPTFSPTWPPTVHATADRGATWTRVPVEPGPKDEMVGRVAVGVAAGKAGVVIATVGSFWVLGENGFDRVDAPFIGDPGLVNVWAVGEGFLAQVGKGYWTSPDGRTWTNVLDAPHLLEIHAVHDGTVYGTAQVHENVVSTDGGRTWQPGLELPVGPPGDLLTVSDIGFVAVETAIFGPCVGVVWVSADGLTWQRVLNPWPTPGMGKPVINGNTILIESTTCGTGDDPVYWIGTIRRPAAR